MRNFKDYLIKEGTLIKDALQNLDILGKDSVLFIVDNRNVLLGSLTDGDIRRFLIEGKDIDQPVEEAMNINPKTLIDNNIDFKKLEIYKRNNLRVIPIIDKDNCLVDVLNFNYRKSILPISAVIMAGGKGTRLLPLTKNKPKPMLQIEGTPIIEYNFNRLESYGIKDFTISLNYLGNQIENHFEKTLKKNLSINYIWEDSPLGTVGALSKLQNISHDHILLSNSDILTDLNYEDFYLDFVKKDSDFQILTIPFNFSVPFAVLEIENESVLGLKEKPSLKHECNAGIYLMKKEIIELIPKETLFDATDLIEMLIELGKKVTSFPFNGYWLDIGRHDDFKKAQNDINKIK